MANKFDPSSPPSPDQEARALSDYGRDLEDPRYRAFAVLVAAGEPLYKAYRAVFPDASDSTCRTQGSILAAHPEVRSMLVRSGLPGRKLVEALVPEAVATLAANLGSESATVRQKAADSILDRGGVPKRTEVETTIREDIQLSGHALLELAAELPVTDLRRRHRRRALPAATDGAGASSLEGQADPDPAPEEEDTRPDLPAVVLEARDRQRHARARREKDRAP